MDAEQTPAERLKEIARLLMVEISSALHGVGSIDAQKAVDEILGEHLPELQKNIGKK